MRLDKFLKITRIIKRRTIAKEACDSGRIMINGTVAKAGTEVKTGDKLSIRFGSETRNVEILKVLEVVKKDDADSMYREIGGDDE